MLRSLAALLIVIAALVVPASASAATEVFSGHTINGQGISCEPRALDNVRVCHGTNGGGTGTNDTRLRSFDGQPLEFYVILPPGTGSDYPLVVQSHGYGGAAGGPDDTGYTGPTAAEWAKDGYAVLQLTARGFGDSCGKATQQSAPLVYAQTCKDGYIRLDDNRYEVRDIQYASGLLADEEFIDPVRIGLTGPSYGGGVSLQLATLKDRVMNADGSLTPWTSPGAHTPMKIAAAAPVIPWSDLVNSLVPNGRTLDYQVTKPTADLAPAGVLKQSFVAGLYALGQASGNYAPPGTNSEADLTTWYGDVNKGEPYDQDPEIQHIIDQIARYHSAYYLLNGAYGAAKQPPAPLLISNGFTDDLFPVDEALRYYNLERSLYPTNPISLLDMDFGHQRGQNKAPDIAYLVNRIKGFFDHYVKGTGAQPQLDATALTQTCPAAAPSGGPFSAATWAALHPGEVDYSSKSAKTISSSAGDPSISKAIDPIAGGGACATAPASDQGSGVASYRLPAATGSGYTLIGSPTVIANLKLTGTFAFIAERLWDVNPSTNTETLVARGVYRIDSSKPDGLQVFQLHPGAWHFAKGHIPKLELLGQDTPYVRSSNGQFSITISDLQLRLPVHEAPGSSGTPPVVKLPKPPVHSHPHSASGCPARPASRIAKARTHGSRNGIVVRGSASERPCATTSLKARRKQHVLRVYVMVYRGVGHGSCRFLQANGKLGGPRACTRPVEFLAKGTKHWKLRLNFAIAPGRYVIRADAVDRLHHHQRRSRASAFVVKVT